MTAEEIDLVALIERRLAEVTNAAVLRLFMPLVAQLQKQQAELDELKARLINDRRAEMSVPKWDKSVPDGTPPVSHAVRHNDGVMDHCDETRPGPAEI